MLSPEIVSEDENTAPSIGEIQWRDGLAIGEGSMVTHLEVSVIDDEWNVVGVFADVSSLGLGEVELNDRGLNGDAAIGDDIYTASLVITGLQVGAQSVSVSATDSFGAMSSATGDLNGSNQRLRLIDL